MEGGAEEREEVYWWLSCSVFRKHGICSYTCFVLFMITFGKLCFFLMSVLLSDVVVEVSVVLIVV